MLQEEGLTPNYNTVKYGGGSILIWGVVDFTKGHLKPFNTEGVAGITKNDKLFDLL